jgi:hypothetical protein
VHRKIDVPPLREGVLREVVSRPAELLSARFETAGLADTRRTAEDSVKDVGTLPLLSYTLDDMWTPLVKRDDGVLRLPVQSFELGGVLVDRADAFLAAHSKSEDELRRLFTLKLATVRESEDPTRRRTVRSKFTDEHGDWSVSLPIVPTAFSSRQHLKGARPTPKWRTRRSFGAGRNYAIGLPLSASSWLGEQGSKPRVARAAPDRSNPDALLMGFALAQAQRWLARGHDGLPRIASSSHSAARQLVARGVRMLLALGVIGGLVAWLNEAWLREEGAG